MRKETCIECGTVFNCGPHPKTGTCWCHNLPNMRDSFDLAGSCFCPNCLTMGKAKSITKARKARKASRKRK